uniref:C2H2-type domain-containing protein n=1 Tax=Macrostomum lignano TaxID=282301 RepID=A0A1I8IIU8_9PLAT
LGPLLPRQAVEDQRLEFSKHCERHAVEAVRVLAVEFGGISAAAELQCQWRNCDARLEICEQELQQNPNRLLELAACHVTQHAHHVIVKQLGRKLIASKGWPECLLNSAFCNSLADQSPEPAPLRCQWDSCEYFTCNTCAFYLHCSNHRFEYERPPPQQKFRQYRQREHRGIRDMPCLWRGCDHVCRSISNLTEHIRCHSKEKPTACPTCGQKFFNNSKLQNHLLRQETPNPVHKCDQCHKLFSSQRILSDHMRRHVNTQKCPHCEFTLPTPSALRRHLQMRHSEERPFVCTEPGCGHSCKTEDQLKVHSRRHDRSLRCDICDQHFVTTHFLYRHLSKAHGFDQLSQSAERVYACHLCHLAAEDEFLPLLSVVTPKAGPSDEQCLSLDIGGLHVTAAGGVGGASASQSEEAVLSSVRSAVIYADSGAADWINWRRLLPRLIEHGALAVREFQPAEKLQQQPAAAAVRKAVFLLAGRPDSRVAMETLAELVSDTGLNYVILLTGACPETAVLMDVEEHLAGWLGHGATAQVRFVPLGHVTLIRPPEDHRLPEFVVLGGGGDDVTDPDDDDVISEPIGHLAGRLHSLLAELSLKEDILCLGPAASRLGDALAALGPAKERRRLPNHRRATVVLVDRALDLVGPLSFLADSWLDTLCRSGRPLLVSDVHLDLTAFTRCAGWDSSGT